MQQDPTSSQATPPDPGAVSLARSLGVVSLLVGAGELLAARRLNDALGTHSPRLTRAYGAREILNGVALLTAKNPTPWVWTRVGGDVVDIASLALAQGAGAKRVPTGVVLAAVLAITAVDIYCAQRLSDRRYQPREDLGGPYGMLHTPPAENADLTPEH